MYARIARDFKFQAGIHFENTFIINSYELSLDMDVTTEDMREQNIALERMKYLLEMCIEDAVFVDVSNKSAIDAYTKAGMKVCNLPDEPFDQVVAAVLLSKFNSITEKKIFVSDIKISSKICDEVSFYISSEEVEDFSSIANVWWTDNSSSISDISKKVNKKEKIVELKKENTDWNSLGLCWKANDPDKKGNEIVFISTEK